MKHSDLTTIVLVDLDDTLVDRGDYYYSTGPNHLLVAAGYILTHLSCPTQTTS